MGLRSSGSYAKVWEVREGKGNYIDAQISISKKNKETGEYTNDFNAWVRMIGGAKDKANSLQRGDTIFIKEFDISNSYNKETKVNNTYYAVFDFEIKANDRNASKKEGDSAKTPKSALDIIDSDSNDEELPF